MSTPELDRLAAVSDESQAIGEFLEWLQSERNIVLAEYLNPKAHLLYPANVGIETLLAQYFKIDLAKVEKERRLLLQSIRH